MWNAGQDVSRIMAAKPVLPVWRWVGLAGLLVGLSAMPAFGQQGAEAAYLMGRAHVAEGDTARALRAWAGGLDSLDAAGLRDARLSDAYIRVVFGSRTEAAYPLFARSPD